MVQKRTRCITARAVSHENIGLRHGEAVVLWKISSALVEYLVARTETCSGSAGRSERLVSGIRVGGSCFVV